LVSTDKEITPLRETSPDAAPPRSKGFCFAKTLFRYPHSYIGLSRGDRHVTLSYKHAFACVFWAPPASIVLIPLRSIPVYSGTPTPWLP
jgi:hypothetical protein